MLSDASRRSAHLRYIVLESIRVCVCIHLDFAFRTEEYHVRDAETNILTSQRLKTESDTNADIHVLYSICVQYNKLNIYMIVPNPNPNQPTQSRGVPSYTA
jgi:hypothetical protein